MREGVPQTDAEGSSVVGAIVSGRVLVEEAVAAVGEVVDRAVGLQAMRDVFREIEVPDGVGLLLFSGARIDQVVTEEVAADIGDQPKTAGDILSSEIAGVTAGFG